MAPVPRSCTLDVYAIQMMRLLVLSVCLPSTSISLESLCTPVLLGAFVPFVCLSAASSQARVPVVKFTYAPTGTSCDVTINNMLPLENTRLLAAYCRADARLRSLALAVKAWAKARGVNDTYRHEMICGGGAACKHLCLSGTAAALGWHLL
jgi:hypothetical protein